MDKRKIEILKLIDKAKNSNYCEDYTTLKRAGYESGLLKSMIDDKLIEYNYSFYLKEKGETILRDYLMIEALDKKNTPKLKIIFDSNVYDEIVSGNLNLNTINKEKYEFYITHIQSDEISSCPDNEKRQVLTLFLLKIAPIIIPTESIVLDVSRFGEAKFGDGQLLEKLKIGNSKHTKDALIGETAIKNKLILVTNDKKMNIRVNLNGGKAIDIHEFKEMLNND
ncbi:MAG: hypothetical protein ABIG84_05145 [archaeon]